MTRRSEREEREMRAITDVVDGVLENWGIEMDRDGSDTRPRGKRFAKQIGKGESVEYNEVYDMILDVAKEIFTMTGKTDAPPTTYQYTPLYPGEGLHDNRLLPVTEESWKSEHRDYEGGQLYEPADGRPARPIVTMWHDPYETPGEAIARLNTEAVENAREAQRLADIIRRTYGTQGWDIGTVKTMLLPGLDGYHSALLRQQERCGHNDTRTNRAGHIECNDCGRTWVRMPRAPHVHERWQLQESAKGGMYCAACGEAVGIPTARTEHFHANNWMLGFGEGSSRDGWWIELELYHQDDDKTDDAIVKAVLSLTDQDAIVLSERLDERVREGRKDWNE